MSLDQIASECHCASAVCQCQQPVLEQLPAIGSLSVAGLASAIDSDIDTNIDIDISGTIFTFNKKRIMENSTLINNALLENPSETIIQLPAVQEYGGTKCFSYFVKFLELEYFEIPKPLPERGAHFTKATIGSDANVAFINNFYDKTILTVNNWPTELIHTLKLANYLGASNFVNWCSAKLASVIAETGLAKVD